MENARSWQAKRPVNIIKPNNTLMNFTYKIQKEETVNIISFYGELIDKSQASGFIIALDEKIENKEIKFIFDLKGLSYINSSGLNVLINILTKCRKADGEVLIANLSEKVNKLFIMTKLNTIFTVTDSVENAVAKLK